MKPNDLSITMEDDAYIVTSCPWCGGGAFEEHEESMHLSPNRTYYWLTCIGCWATTPKVHDIKLLITN